MRIWHAIIIIVGIFVLLGLAMLYFPESPAGTELSVADITAISNEVLATVQTQTVLSDTVMAMAVTSGDTQIPVTLHMAAESTTNRIDRQMAATTTYAIPLGDAAFTQTTTEYIIDDGHYARTHTAFGVLSYVSYEESVLADPTAFWAANATVDSIPGAERRADAVINGIDCFVIGLSFDAADYESLFSNDFGSSRFGGSDDMFDFTALFDLYGDTLSSYTYTLWIAKDTFLPVQSSTTLELAVDEGVLALFGGFTGMPTMPAEFEAALNLTGQINYSDYNAPLSIAVPEDFDHVPLSSRLLQRTMTAFDAVLRLILR